MKSIAVLVSLAALISAPAVASAQDVHEPLFADGSYLSFAVGATNLHHHSFTVPAGHIGVSPSTGAAFVISGGHDYGRVWPLGDVRVEIGLGYRDNTVDRLSLPGDVDMSNPSGRARVWSLTYNVINDFRSGTAFDPYVGIGIGYAHVEMDYAAAGTKLVTGANSGFAWQGMIGFRSALNAHLNLDVSWRYFTVSDPKFTWTSGSTTTSYQSDAILVGLTYTF